MSIQEQFQRLIKGGLMICVATVLMVGLISCSSSSSDSSDSTTTDLSGTVSTDAGTTTGRIVDGILLETVTNPLVGATVCVGDLISLECGDITAITDDTGSFTLSDVPNDDLDGTAYVSSVLTETDVDSGVETTTEISSYITEGQTEIDANILTNTSVQTQIAAVFDSGTGDTMGQVEGFGDDSEIDYFDVFGEMQDIIYNDEDYPPFMDYTMDTICPTDETCSDDMGLDQTQTLMVIKAKANFEAYITQQGLEGDTTFTDLVVGFQEDLGDMYSEAVSEFPDGYETTMIFSDEWGTTDQTSYSTYEVAMPAGIEMADFPENMVWHEGTDLDTNYDNFVFADGATFVGDFDMPTDAIPGDGCVFGVGFQIPLDSEFATLLTGDGIDNATFMDNVALELFDEAVIQVMTFDDTTNFAGDFVIDDDVKTAIISMEGFTGYTPEMIDQFGTFTVTDMTNMGPGMTEEEFDTIIEGGVAMPIGTDGETWDFTDFQEVYTLDHTIDWLAIVASANNSESATLDDVKTFFEANLVIDNSTIEGSNICSDLFYTSFDSGTKATTKTDYTETTSITYTQAYKGNVITTATTDGVDYISVTTYGMPNHNSHFFYNDEDNTLCGNGFSNGNLTGFQETLTIPLTNTIGGETDTGFSTIGIAINGISYYNEDTAESTDAYDEEAITFDSYLGHPDDKQDYHYHVEPIYYTGDTDSYTPTTKATDASRSRWVGIVLDGIPIFGPFDTGQTTSPTDLDDCRGHVSEVVMGTYTGSVYHYHVQDVDDIVEGDDSDAYIIGCYSGSTVGSSDGMPN